MCLQVGRINRDGRRFRRFGGQSLEDPSEYAHLARSLPTVVEGLGWTVFLRRIAPVQAIAIDEDYAAQHATIIDTRATMALWK